MIYLLLCVSLFLYEATGRPAGDGQSNVSPPLDPLAVLRMCRRPVSNGSKTCRGMLKRYYYDSLSQSCRSFAWTGCGGNDNRFESKDECENRCGDVLPCRQTRPRPAPEGCTIFRAIDISDGCPVYHWDCHDTPRTGSCPPAIDIGPLPNDCLITSIRTAAGCTKDIVTCS